MYCGNYALMPARFIAYSLEQDVLRSLHRKYREDSAPEIMKHMRQEWTALLETAAAQELAALYELTVWLRTHAHPYWIGGNAPSGFVPYLLGITRVNPLPTELGGQNLVWQEFCSYGRAPLYEILLSEDLKPRIIEWLKDHWLSKVNHFDWKALQPYEPRYIRRGNMYFRFDLDDDSTLKNCEMPTLCREDIFFYLKKQGFVDKDAFRGMNSVRKGKGFPVITAEMRNAEDNWILKAGEHIKWLPSRANLMEQNHFIHQYLKEKAYGRASVYGLTQKTDLTVIHSSGKQGKCAHNLQKPPISADTEMGGFELVGSLPNPLATQTISVATRFGKSLFYGITYPQDRPIRIFCSFPSSVSLARIRLAVAADT